MIVLDTETGGLDPNGCALISVCLLRVESNEVTSLYVKPVEGLAYTAEAQAVHGLSLDTLQKKGVPEVQVMQDVAAFCEKWPDEEWLGCNPYFDRGFLAAAARRCGVPVKLPRRMIDLQSIAWLCDRLNLLELPRCSGGRPLASLDAILKALGMARSSGVHLALEDCLLTARAWRRLWTLLQGHKALRGVENGEQIEEGGKP